MKDKELVVTFDDGPRGFTNDILDFLKKENIKASFFVIGNTLIDEKGLANETYINIIRRDHREGHIVAITHILMLQLTLLGYRLKTKPKHLEMN